jgi:hypothetical protein
LPAAMEPSLPWIKIIRVEATLSESRNRVTSNKMEGKADKSKGLRVYIEASRMMSAKVILNEISRSNTTAGKGITIKTKIPTTATAKEISLFFVMPGIFGLNRVCSAAVIMLI